MLFCREVAKLVNGIWSIGDLKVAYLGKRDEGSSAFRYVMVVECSQCLGTNKLLSHSTQRTILCQCY